jgi:hypothetical protein
MPGPVISPDPTIDPGLDPPAGDLWVSPWPPGSTSIAAIPQQVYRLQDGELWRLTSLECIDVAWYHGSQPKTARFSYTFGDFNPNAPQTIEQALSTSLYFPDTVRPGDRLLVRILRPDGAWYWIFDGFPFGFEALVDEDGESVLISAAGVEKTLANSVVPGQVLRNSGSISIPGKWDNPNHCETDIPAIFNQGGMPNCTPLAPTSDFNRDLAPERSYPVFVDPLVVRSPDLRTFWTLNVSVAYLIYTMNALETLVTSPDRSYLDRLLFAREPIADFTFDPTDPTTYVAAPICTPEVPITGRPFLPTVEALICDKGFAVTSRLLTPTDFNQRPRTFLDLYLQMAAPVKDLWLQPTGAALDLQRTNLGDCSLSRELSQAVNRWIVDGAPILVELTVVLACMFPSTDGDASNLPLYDLNQPGFFSQRNVYRLYGYDETGEGHYQPHSTIIQTAITSLDPILGGRRPDGTRQYAERRRPGRGNLITIGPDGRPLRATLAYSDDYAGISPGLWDGTGTWKPIQGGYDLLPDRLGIWINVQAPNEWLIGHDGDGAPVSLAAIECQALDNAEHKKFYLRLTTVVEADLVVQGVAIRRLGAPLQEIITRRVDARDRYLKALIAPRSEFNNNALGLVVRDDTSLAYAEAVSLRDATDAGTLDGPVTIPWVTMMYDIGDQIRSINGRNLGLRTDTGPDSQRPILPVIQSIHWRLKGDQSTTIQLSDGQLLRKHHHREVVASGPGRRPRPTRRARQGPRPSGRASA